MNEDDWYDKVLETPEYTYGFDMGESLKSYEMYREAEAAHKAGEIELWLEAYRPKSMEDWLKFEKEHGTHEELKKRWGIHAEDK